MHVDLINNKDFLRQKLEEAKLNIAVQVGDAVILDYARTPGSPIGPNHNRNILLGLFIGLVTGLGISFLIEFLDNTLKTVDEIERYNLNVLGIIPAIGAGTLVNKNSFLSFHFLELALWTSFTYFTRYN